MLTSRSQLSGDDGIRTDERGDYAVSTLIVFIAVVLIAAAFAGVLFETYGMLGAQTEATGQETASQLSDRIEVVTVTGSEITDSGTGEREIRQVEIIVTTAPGSDPIDLQNLTVQWVADAGYVLHHEDVADPGQATFSTVKYTDADDSYPILTTDDDRFALRFEPGEQFGDSGLTTNDEVHVTLLSPTGSAFDLTFTVPRSLVGKDSIEM